MATNNNGNLLDTSGEVAVDFVWGNFPIQPNDARPDAASATLSTTVTTRVAGRLDPEADNHIIALSGWNGFPLYNPNTAGEDVAGDAVDYVLVPSVLGLTTALAQDAMKDASLVVTTAAGATNTRTQLTRINVTATTAATVYVTGGTGTWPVGTKVTIGSGTGVPTALVGSWAITGGTSSTLVISGSGWTVADTGSITPGTVLSGEAATIKTQSRAAGANEVAPGSAVTITPWATAS
jgi:hypothetical protein